MITVFHTRAANLCATVTRGGIEHEVTDIQLCNGVDDYTADVELTRDECDEIELQASKLDERD